LTLKSLFLFLNGFMIKIFCIRPKLKIKLSVASFVCLDFWDSFDSKGQDLESIFLGRVIDSRRKNQHLKNADTSIEFLYNYMPPRDLQVLIHFFIFRQTDRCSRLQHRPDSSHDSLRDFGPQASRVLRRHERHLLQRRGQVHETLHQKTSLARARSPQGLQRNTGTAISLNDLSGVNLTKKKSKCIEYSTDQWKFVN